jgi:transposase
MPTERLSMRDIKAILRQKWQLCRSHRQTATSVGVSAGAVGETMRRVRAAGLTCWKEVEDLSPQDLEARLYPSVVASARPAPNCVWIHKERRKVGVTLELLHLEYLERHPDGYSYTQFCDIYRDWLAKRGVVMRQVHRAGEKLFVDYSGKRPWIWDAKSGERIDVELFVAVLGASNLTYAEATMTQRGPDWIASHARAFAYIGGVTEAVVCDQLKSGVTTTCRYEPGIQRTYEEMAAHYNTTVLPARAGHPRDKAKVETAVLVAQRWIVARLRNEKHFSLDSLNARIAELLEELNARRMRVYQVSRRDLFEEIERRTLRPLPTERFVYGDWKTAKVSVDYHIEVDGHYYSVPHAHLGEHVDVRLSASTVEVFLRQQRIASHARSYQRGRHTTVTEHMPKSHQAHLEWSPSRMINWAATIGPQTRSLVVAILAERTHPEQGYRSCLGILRLGKRYGDSRLEAACARAFTAGARSYRHVDSILKHGLDRAPLATAELPTESARQGPHENIRGADYYQ